MAMRPTVIFGTLWPWLIWWSLAEAAEVCTPVDMTTWTPTQRASLWGLAYAVAYQAAPASNPKPMLREPNRVCFEAPTFPVSTVITTQTLLAQWTRDREADAVFNQRELTAESAARRKLRGLGLTEEEVDALRRSR